MTKKIFLAVYDYGQGGVWAIVKARSAPEVTNKYPELTIYEGRPPFINESNYENIAANMTVDIDDEPRGWLAELIKQRP